MFSCGVILFAMVTGSLPYLVDASADDPIYKHLKIKNVTGYWDAWHGYSRPSKMQAMNSLVRESNF